MESRCAICGNRTEDMDLATVEFEGVSVKACPYCRKQLSQFLQDPARNAAWLSGVLRVDEKHTRTPEATAVLTRLAYQNDIARPAPANAETPPANPAAKRRTVGKTCGEAGKTAEKLKTAAVGFQNPRNCCAACFGARAACHFAAFGRAAKHFRLLFVA